MQNRSEARQRGREEKNSRRLENGSRERGKERRAKEREREREDRERERERKACLQIVGNLWFLGLRDFNRESARARH